MNGLQAVVWWFDEWTDEAWQVHQRTGTGPIPPPDPPARADGPPLWVTKVDHETRTITVSGENPNGISGETHRAWKDAAPVRRGVDWRAVKAKRKQRKAERARRRAGR